MPFASKLERQYLSALGMPHRVYYTLPAEAIEQALSHVKEQHTADEADLRARAVARLCFEKYEKKAHEKPSKPAIEELRSEVKKGQRILVVGLLILIALLLATRAHAQSTANYVNARIINSPSFGRSWTLASGTDSVTVVQATGTNLHIVCDSGCGGAASFTDSSAFTFATTPVNNISAVVDDVATNTVAENSAGALRMSTNRLLYIDLSKTVLPAGTNVIGHIICDSGCGGAATFTDASAFTFGTTPVNNTSFVVDDVSTNTVAENSAGAARMNTNRILYMDLSKTAANATAVKVDNSAVTQPVSGTVAVTNLDVALSTRTKPADQQHVLLDANSGIDIGKLTANQSVNVAQVNGVTTATGSGVMGTGVQRIAISSDNDPLTVKQATAANLNATVVGTGTFVTQSTLAAETTKVIGTVRATGNVGGVFDTTQNAAVAANSVLQGCNFTTSPASITSGNQGAMQCNSKGEVLTQITDGTTNVAVVAGTTALKTDMSSVAGTATSTGAGATGAGVLRVNDVGSSATGAAVPASASYTGGTDGANLVGFFVDPCAGLAKSYSPVNIVTATTVRFAAPAASKKTYICSIVLVAASADNVNIIEGTGGTCGTATAGVAGGTTAATGLNLPANGGLTLGNGASSVMATAGTNVDMCLITSAAVQLSGHISWVQR